MTNSSRKKKGKTEVAERLVRIYHEPHPTCSTLIVGWKGDAGEVGSRTIDYLVEKTAAKEWGKMELWPFFPLDGVSVEDDVARFPDSRFYSSEARGLLFFKSDPPRTEWRLFLDTLLGTAKKSGVADVYSMGGILAALTHEQERKITAVTNSSKLRQTLVGHGANGDLDYETPPEQRPTLNSYLLWTAKQKRMRAANLWIPVPFYLAGAGDPRACRGIVQCLNERLGLGLDLSDLDGEIEKQDQTIAGLKERAPDVGDYMRRIDAGTGLTADEIEKLAEEVARAVRGKT